MKIFLVPILIFLFYLILQLIYSTYYIRKANQLNKTVFTGDKILGQEGKPVFRLFVAGDSIGAGVGASSFEKSVVGRLGDYLSKNNKVYIENISVVGEKVQNLKNRKLPEQTQDLIVLIVSSNDLFHFTNLETFEKDTRQVLERYSKPTKKLVIIGPGNIAEPAAIPLILKPVYALQGQKYAAAIKRALSNCSDCSYVNPLEHPNNLGPYGPTYAADNFHPNDEGHRYWFDMIRSGI